MFFEIYDEPPSSGILGLPGLMQPKDIEWRWRLKGDNYKTVASGESYKNKDDCLHAINLLMGTNFSTKINDLSVDRL
ncbi:YegP family protein [Candidatus Nitrotoga arctica]|uniref:DUF1508 domain-containing protein n=1 Tax=Candidatus Nitrotoga arctica TaxID=453162 RepID=A0ABM8Z2Q2_9PROT|nr:DUF1508 domain-containing protein [Candidatus Nitrotoga arctica]CAG9934096.1 conserved protein of unknown function [Candidatus Nitrotoga arctica]